MFTIDKCYDVSVHLMMIEAVGKDIDKHKASIPIEPTLRGPCYAKISAVCNEGNHLCGHFSFQVKTASTQIIYVPPPPTVFHRRWKEGR